MKCSGKFCPAPRGEMDTTVKPKEKKKESQEQEGEVNE